jgi:hypothetical protein
MEVTQDQFVQGLLYALGYVLGWFWPRRKSIGEPPGRAGAGFGLPPDRGGDNAAQSILCDRGPY